MKVYLGPQQNRIGIVAITPEEAARVQRFVVRAGTVERARMRLRIGESTMDAARGCGNMMRSTRDKLLEALDREEGTER